MHQLHSPGSQRRYSSRTETVTRPRYPREHWNAISLHTRSQWKDDTHSNRIVRRSDSSVSPTAPTPALSLSNRARADSTFPVIPGCFFRCTSAGVSIYVTIALPHAISKACSKKTIEIVSINGKVDREKLTASCITWLFIDCCCDTYPKHGQFGLVTTETWRT